MYALKSRILKINAALGGKALRLNYKMYPIIFKAEIRLWKNHLTLINLESWIDYNKSKAEHYLDTDNHFSFRITIISSVGQNLGLDFYFNDLDLK
ncbi:hypothetical protein BpHYR1_038609 [Brachionus plicatilis]|uniref:Uncharacterized protein n=1 Tax=Brachionus plicatilis TaxID=10195 RepID=A0A3M7RL13_BRAPC|nr:hypothetical protein BpHYR1_038609 [Brachionus plicatilis]